MMNSDGTVCHLSALPLRGESRGFTLIELLVSLIVFGVVMTVALSFLQVQTKGFRIGLDHMASLQTLRYSLGTLEQDIQTAGTNVVAGQPELVYAGPNMMAFNADYATRRRNDPFAVYYDPNVEPRASFSATKGQQFTLPGTSFIYPDTTYAGGGTGRSPAETLVFFFTPDTTTARTDDFALYRQANDTDPQLVSTNLLATENEPFFRYYKESSVGVDSILPGFLPLFHSAPTHGSPADTGAMALIDSIRAVRVTLTATNGKEGDAEERALLTRIIRMPNVGFGTLETCGSTPLLGGGISASLVTVDGSPAVLLTWGKATDEGGGENDVVRYVLYRRLASEAAFDEPYLSIPAGETNYTYVDGDVEAGEGYVYALAAQDCTPTLSALSSSISVTVPN
jgi:prepilin-type N-terminal cleavage/methylation domain-containing protein